MQKYEISATYYFFVRLFIAPVPNFCPNSMLRPGFSSFRAARAPASVGVALCHIPPAGGEERGAVQYDAAFVPRGIEGHGVAGLHLTCSRQRFRMFLQPFSHTPEITD